MASPVGHSLVGLAMSGGRDGRRIRWGRVLFAIFAVNAPDLDYVAGLAMGELGGLHRGPSHSLGAALLFGIAVMVVARLAKWESPLRYGGWAAALYATHLVFDLLGYDNGGPSGLPVLWPLLSDVVVWPWPVLPGMTNAADGTQVWTFVRSVFSLSNGWVVLVESMVLLPWVAVVWLRRPVERRWRARVVRADETPAEGMT